MAVLAAEFGVTQTTILAALRRQGIPRRPVHRPGRAPIPLNEDDLRQWAVQGMSTREMAALSRSSWPKPASEETIRRELVRLGIDRLPAKARVEKNVFWSGGLIVDKSGYLLAKQLDHPRRTKAGYVRLHRLVMERHLGRFLETAEVVDHLDGDTSDNRIQNLVLYASNGEHLRATLTGRHRFQDRLSRAEREVQRRAAVQRGRDRVAAIHRERGSGAYLSPSELDQWIDELATGAPRP